MPAPFDKKFLERFFNDDCSPQEKAEFRKWLKNPGQQEGEEWMRKIWNERHSVDREFLGAEGRIYQEILSRLNHSPKSIPRRDVIKPAKRPTRLGIWQYWSKTQALRYAAVFLVLIASIAGVRHFALENSSISATDTKPLAYKKASTEAGQKRTFRLPDGTQVILNSNSSLEYPEAFSDTARNVVLHGEAYFEVARDVHAPFTVRSGNLVTLALGTSFNIRCNDNEMDRYVSLTSGKVLVYDSLTETSQFGVLLKPGEELAYHSKDHTYDTKPFDYHEKIAWKDGVLYFGEDDLEGIVKKIEQWYGVTVHLENRPGTQWVFTGEFKDQSLKNVLRGMAYSKDFKFSIVGKDVYLDFKTKSE